MSRRESIGRVKARTQSASGPPTQEMVSVAVLPPRLPQGMAPPTGVGAADVFDWDEAINWRHNEPIQKEEEVVSKRKKAFRKAGLTTRRSPANPDLPPFTLRQVTYETWRKHYAKDKDGNYHGTHAPAEDCLLKPDDVQKWRLGEPVTQGDRWTRGKQALPVYAEVEESSPLPQYAVDYNGPPPGEPTFNEDDGWASDHQASRTASSASSVPVVRREIIAEGKTAEEIIAEAKAKAAPKLTWRQMFGKGIAGTMGS